MHCWNKVYTVSMHLPPGLLAVPGKIEKVQWYCMMFCQPHRAAFRAANHDLDTMTVEEVTKFMQVQWLDDKASGKLARLAENQRANRQRYDTYGRGRGRICNDRYKSRRNDRSSDQRREGRFSTGNSYGRGRGGYTSNSGRGSYRSGGHSGMNSGQNFN